MRRFWHMLRVRLSTAPIVILIENGAARSSRGSVTRGLLADISEVARAKRIVFGAVTVRPGAGKSSLSFIGTFDEGTKQRLRNVWFSHPDSRAR